MARMAADCAVELRKSGVTMISLWPGPVKTELLNSFREGDEEMTRNMPGIENGESIEFTGKAGYNFLSDLLHDRLKYLVENFLLQVCVQLASEPPLDLMSR